MYQIQYHKEIPEHVGVFRQLLSTKVKLKELQEKISIYLNYILYILNILKKPRGYIQSRGKTHLGEGSETNAVQRMMELYGIVPYEVYEGKPSDQPFYNHDKMFSEIEIYLKSCKKTNFWDEESILSNIKSILNHYMGTPPTKFRYNGRTYTPKGFMRYVTKLNPSNYLDFMSLT